jgi:hypothetical protein
MPGRERFPTRQYAYGTAGRAAFTGVDQPGLAAGGIYRFLLGKDPEPVPLASDVIKAELHDPFAELVLAAGDPLPVTLRALLAALDARNADPAGLPVQASFVVADGGQILWSAKTAQLQRQIRFAITRGKASNSSAPELMISTSDSFDSPTTFLQVIGWDPVDKTYRFYDRRAGAWIYAGSSWDALVPPTRGKGPFDSHVNGALNMKELKIPWQNWHSEAAGIKDDILAPDDKLRSEILWTGRSPAQQFEISVIRPGIIRWMEARFAACVDGNRLTRFPEFIRHLLETTTVNLASSVAENRQLDHISSFKLPLTFFFNSDTLLNTLELEPDIAVPQVDAGLYRDCLTKFEVAVTDGNYRFAGDTHFVFVVPEPAFEDQTIVSSLITSETISRKLAACLLMVDFCNPIFSARRAALMKYVPQTAACGGTGDLPSFVAAVTESASALPPGSAEAEFLTNWELPDNGWQHVFEKRIEDFMGKIADRLTSAVGVQDLFRLAESRRREFRKRPLAEFRLTTPVTNIPESAALLQLTADGRVVEKT